MFSNKGYHSTLSSGVGQNKREPLSFRLPANNNNNYYSSRRQSNLFTNNVANSSNINSNNNNGKGDDIKYPSTPITSNSRLAKTSSLLSVTITPPVQNTVKVVRLANNNHSSATARRDTTRLQSNSIFSSNRKNNETDTPQIRRTRTDGLMTALPNHGYNRRLSGRFIDKSSSSYDDSVNSLSIGIPSQQQFNSSIEKQIQNLNLSSSLSAEPRTTTFSQPHEEIAKRDQQISTLITERNHFQIEHGRLFNQFSTLQRQADQLEIDLNKKNIELDSLRLQHGQLREEHQKLRQVLSELQREKKRQEQEKDEEKVRAHQLEIQIKTLGTQLDQKKANASVNTQASNQKLTELTRQNKALKERYSSVQEENHQLAKRVSELKIGLDENKALREEILKMKIELEDLTKKLEDSRTSMMKISSEKAILQQENNRMKQQQLSGMESDSSGSSSGGSILKEQLSLREEWNLRFAELEKEKDETKMALSKAMSVLENEEELVKELTRKERIIVELREAIEKLQQHLQQQYSETIVDNRNDMFNGLLSPPLASKMRMEAYSIPSPPPVVNKTKFTTGSLKLPSINNHKSVQFAPGPPTLISPPLNSISPPPIGAATAAVSIGTNGALAIARNKLRQLLDSRGAVDGVSATIVN